MKPAGALPLFVRPCELPEANALIERWHRHHKKVVSHRWSIKAIDAQGHPRGVAICGRPVARQTDRSAVLEIARLATDGTPNACSFLYGACRRVAKAQGWQLIQTFILESEPGTSLRAAGFVLDGHSKGGAWPRPSRPNRREDQPHCRKQRWICELRHEVVAP